MTPRRIRVLVAEDSPVVQLLLTHLLNADPQLEVVATANDGQEAVDLALRENPDVVLMDVHMPRVDGYEATRRIMETRPVPIVICSASMRTEEVGITFHAIEAGAVAFVEKPVGMGDARFDGMVEELTRTLKLMAEVRVVRRWRRTPGGAAPAASVMRRSSDLGLVAIGASTGGPPALRAVLSGLPAQFPAPILIVQHIAAGFMDGFLDWLGQTTPLTVELGARGVQPQPGHVYLAPDGVHMGVTPDGRIGLGQEAPENGLRPAVSYLFRSVAEVHGAQAVGVLLSGMGRDGASELKLMKDRGAVTIAQDAETSIVHGMPGEAIRSGGASYVLPCDQIASALVTLARCR